jgi:CRP-like cAMP-binding protein
MGVLDSIKASSDLSEARPETLEELARSATLRRFHRGEHLFWEGDEPDSAYLIVDGIVRLFQSVANDHHLSIDDMRQGEFVGEMSALVGVPRPAAAIALKLTETLRIPSHALKRGVCSDVGLAYRLLISTMQLVLEKDVRMATGLTGDLITKLAWQLNFEYSRNGNSMHLHLSHADLAERIGVTRESVSRSLGVLRAKGYVRSGANGLEIVDLEGLRGRFLALDY